MNISSSMVGDELHTVSVDGDKLWHCIMSPDGSWSPWGYLQVEGWTLTEVSSASQAGNLHTVVKTEAGIFLHNIRLEDGEWQGWVQLPEQPPADE
jgi:hypothetical protein